MIAAYLKKRLARFEKHYSYDASYLHEIVDLDASAGFKLMMAMGFLGHKYDLPAKPLYAAKARSLMRADCGPCLRLAIDMAREAGVTAKDLLPALGHGEADPDTALAIAFADAVFDDAPELLEIVEKVRERFGHSGHTGLAVAVLSGQFYPTLKRGLGHGAACEPVVKMMIEQAGNPTEQAGNGFDKSRRQAAGVS